MLPHGSRPRPRRNATSRSGDRGASAVEYALMLGFIIMVMIASFYAMGDAFNVKFAALVDWLTP
ncbi:hypothetical protein GCM10009681_01970 [Luedemannella helvata]|uniref:Flp family type IVb pilin n=1 Tax=Luedemannella helvata TaxID=349315 RepID=A0ABP4VR45_9ACTN